MLTALGVKRIYEANNGTAGIETIKELKPDIAFVDWEMPGVDGHPHGPPAGIVSGPDVPIILPRKLVVLPDEPEDNALLLR